MLRNLTFVAALAVALALTGSAGAALVTYDFASETLAPATVDPAVDATSMIAASGMAGLTAGDYGYTSTDPSLKAYPGGGVSTWTWEGVTYRSSNQALDNNYYFYFTVTPKAGQTMNLTELTFKAAGGGASDPPRTAYVMSDLTGGSKLLTANLGVDSSTARPNWTELTVDLSGSEFQGLDSTTPVTFKFLVATGSSTKSLEYDDFALEGNVVPEPATMTMVALGLAGLAARRRKA